MVSLKAGEVTKTSAAFGLDLGAQITSLAGRSEVRPARGSYTNGARTRQQCSSGGPALLSGHRREETQLPWNQRLNLQIPARTGLPTANHPLHKHHRAVTSVGDRLWRPIVLFSQ